MNRLFFVAVLAAALTAPITAQETLLLFVRHAEKQTESGNPDLTERGLARAEALAEIAQEWDVRGVYSTDFCRTAQTAQPTAVRMGIPVSVQSTGGADAGIDDCDPAIEHLTFFLDPSVASAADLLSWILDQHAGQAVLVVGHSNTVPRLLARIGAGSFAAIEITEDQYDRLYMVTYAPGQRPTMVERSYGELYDEFAADPDPTTSSQPVARLDIVERAIAHHGGDRYRNSHTRLTITSKSGSFGLSVVRDDGLYDYAVTDSRDGQERVTRLTNDTVERSLGGAREALDEEGSRRARDFVNARVYFPFLPYGLNDPDVFKIDQGLEHWYGEELHRVKVVFTPGSSTDASDEYVYWFEPDSGRLRQYGYSFGAGRDSGGLRFRRLSNYRRIEGILFFDADNRGVDGSGPFTVDLIDEESVADSMTPISEVRLTEIEVTPAAGR